MSPSLPSEGDILLGFAIHPAKAGLHALTWTCSTQLSKIIVPVNYGSPRRGTYCPAIKEELRYIHSPFTLCAIAARGDF